jgi:hypothetical protein
MKTENTMQIIHRLLESQDPHLKALAAILDDHIAERLMEITKGINVPPKLSNHVKKLLIKT